VERTKRLSRIMEDSMNIKFMLAKKEDAPEIIRVQNESFQEDYEAYGECPAYEETKKAMESHIESLIVYKILMDEDIIGDIIIRPIDENKYYHRVISIVPRYQNLGIGQKAFEFIERNHQRVKEWELITPFKSFRNHHLYEKLGYIKVEEYKHSDILNMFRYRKIIP
jgi:GNAT superfamily N-acetyltransferase